MQGRGACPARGPFAQPPDLGLHGLGQRHGLAYRPVDVLGRDIAIGSGKALNSAATIACSISEPLNPPHWRARRSISNDLAWRCLRSMWIRRISLRSASVGRSTKNISSNRPLRSVLPQGAARRCRWRWRRRRRSRPSRTAMSGRCRTRAKSCHCLTPTTWCRPGPYRSRPATARPGPRIRRPTERDACLSSDEPMSEAEHAPDVHAQQRACATDWRPPWRTGSCRIPARQEAARSLGGGRPKARALVGEGQRSDGTAIP